ncbi:hypothetical protein BaRGS_00021164, partial [Batillaria attramentaria]
RICGVVRCDHINGDEVSFIKPFTPVEPLSTKRWPAPPGKPVDDRNIWWT